ncbi:MAG: DNA recombination protein RmuC [Gemmatimonadetes bacterium]|nr:DNA recombination protein RmuC [Gemmatimonadota bacterium]MYA77939.1 DNA recombination protein RmuC [Gemmatimonadota bacterium]MYG16560.1 DNA recombination protein RmuC [Gemmatimonadota bacterium]MYH17835.1 DNA recombination protein RmuC [Gemmatimonadota bacterium]MYK98176.1 DNA recombination protein RmuC [Gemmatimonadota bacterium]
MDILTIILLIALLACLALAAGVLVWSFRNSSRINALSGEKAAMETELGVVREQLAEAGKSLEEVRKLEVERAGLLQKLSNAEERLGERDEVEKRFKDTFKALSSEVLKSQQESFKANAEESLKARQEAVEKLVKPLSEKIESLDKARAKNAGEFQTQISNLMRTNKELAGEAQTLSNALKRPDVRGRWGETQLERVLELSGLRKDIDFTVQDSFDSEGERIRTDVIVHLPQDRTVILDSKVSLTALMEAFETDDDDTRSAAFDRHVSQVKSHVDSLARKEYWSVLASTPDMVVMVLPEFAFLPAIEREPGLTERALEKNVVIVTPPALLALLKAVEMSWQQIRVAETARQISDLGKEMYDRLAVFAGHYVNVGNSLRQAIERYNRSVGSWDTRVATSAQRFSDLNVPITRELPEVPPVDAVPGSIQKLTDGNLADGKLADDDQAENADGRVVDNDG